MASKKEKKLLKVRHNGKPLPITSWSVIDLSLHKVSRVDKQRHLIDENNEIIVCLDDLWIYKEITTDQINLLTYILSLCPPKNIPSRN